MPTDQPSNAPDELPADARDDAAPGAVLADERFDTTPGGGGLGGSSAAEALGGADRAGGTGPGAPIDTHLAAPGDPTSEAQSQDLETTPSTGGRSSGS